MRKLVEILQTGTIPELRARRRSLVAYRDKMARTGRDEDERLEADIDIQEINERIKVMELGGILK